MSDEDGNGAGPIEGAPPAEDPAKTTNPLTGQVRGECQVCHEPVSGYYCDEHRPARAKAQSAARKAKKTRKDSAPRPKKTTAPGRDSQPGRSIRQLETDMRVTYELMADIWAIRDPQCAGVLRAEAPDIAERWATLAEQDQRVRDFLERLSGGAGLLGLLIAHVPVILAIMEHHVSPAIARRRAAAAGAAAGGGFPLPRDEAERAAFRAEWEALPEDAQALFMQQAEAAGAGDALREALGLIGATAPGL